MHPQGRMIRGHRGHWIIRQLCSINDNEAEFRNKLREMAELSFLHIHPENVLILKDSEKFQLSLEDSHRYD